MSIGIGATLGAYETADGRFLINSRIDEATISPITLVLNWKSPGTR